MEEKTKLTHHDYQKLIIWGSIVSNERNWTKSDSKLYMKLHILLKEFYHKQYIKKRSLNLHKKGG